MPSPPTESINQRVRAALDDLRHELLSERTGDGHWVGELAPSALSTATAVSAMSAVGLRANAESDEGWHEMVSRGVAYLRGQQNDDGGFGDTDRSHSNVATSYLVLAASTLAETFIGDGLERGALERLRAYLQAAGSMEALRARYGKDQTFVVPIMTNLAIAGLVDWNEVPRLPFEAAVFPQSMYRLLRMPVVSYAIPALVAIGQTRHFHGRPAALPWRWVRQASIGRTMRVLRKMQPESGGYLEATPLTSFVVMSLAVTGRADCDVARDGLRFLRDSMGDDGSWPIDTNLATWVTSLAVQALAADPDDDRSWCGEPLVRWHLACQHQRRHPYTGAEPGGWGWTDLSGAVPDSDDTPAAILALRQCRGRLDEPMSRSVDHASEAGVAWLIKLQNRNGGWPTFCRGWGKLPFDRSSTDLTAHAIRALAAENERSESPLEDRLQRRIGRAISRGVRFLRKEQQGDGSWLPLWFGNQDRPDESNPVYGTAKVLLAGPRWLGAASARRGMDYLLRNQNGDGGWGGGDSVGRWMNEQHRPRAPRSPDTNRNPATNGNPVTSSAEREVDATRDSMPVDKRSGDLQSTVEETALAVEALAENLRARRPPGPNEQGRIGESPHGGGGIQQAGNANFFAESGEKSRQWSLGGGNRADEVAIIRGVEFLLRAVAEGRHRVPWPIGFYFAKLWYHERLYPLIFAVAALGSYLRLEAEWRSETRPTCDVARPPETLPP